MQSETIELDFKAAMRRLAGTVSVISCEDPEGGWHGITATSVTSVSMQPPTLLVCVNHSASLHSPLHASGRFCVNMLTPEHVDVAQAFGGKLKGAARFEVGAWHREWSLPALRGAQANVFCEVVTQFSHGSHSIFLGRVVSVQVQEAICPLLYHDGSYSRAARLDSRRALA